MKAHTGGRGGVGAGRTTGGGGEGGVSASSVLPGPDPGI